MKTVKGTYVDLSSYNKIFDPVKLSKSCDGVILRLGYTGFVTNKPALDTQFDKMYYQCKEYGIPVGCYYFTIAYTEEMAKAEAAFIINTLKNYKMDLPVIIDVESQKNSAGWTNQSRANRTKYVKIVLDRVEAAGYYTMVYGSTSATFKTLVDDSKLTHFDHWIAQYAKTNTYKGNYNLWQYTSSADASAYGIYHSSNKLDLSNAYIDYPEVIKKAGLNNLDVVYEDVPVVSVPEVAPVYHKVVKGDTLSKLAIRYKTTVEKIVADNVAVYPRMTKNYIVVGWDLKVR